MYKILLLPGHNGLYKKCGDVGAINKQLTEKWYYEDGLGTEFAIVRHIATNLYKKLTHVENLRLILGHRGIEEGAYSKLPNEVNELNPDLVIELHLNSAENSDIQGCETLYYHSSSKGKHIAEIIQRNLVETIGIKNRGIKPIKREDRGGYLLQKTKAPAVIVEGFFISGVKSTEERDELIDSYTDAMFSAIMEIYKEQK